MTELKFKGVVVSEQGILRSPRIEIRDTRFQEGWLPRIVLGKFFNKTDFPFRKGQSVEIIIRKKDDTPKRDIKTT